VTVLQKLRSSSRHEASIRPMAPATRSRISDRWFSIISWKSRSGERAALGDWGDGAPACGGVC
jgi:hypothetical protein